MKLKNENYNIWIYKINWMIIILKLYEMRN